MRLQISSKMENISYKIFLFLVDKQTSIHILLITNKSTKKLTKLYIVREKSVYETSNRRCYILCGNTAFDRQDCFIEDIFQLKYFLLLQVQDSSFLPGSPEVLVSLHGQVLVQLTQQAGPVSPGESISHDFTRYFCGSSCNYLFFIASFSQLYTFIFLASPPALGESRIRLRKKRKENETEKRDLHELPHKEIVKSTLILQDSPQVNIE